MNEIKQWIKENYLKCVNIKNNFFEIKGVGVFYLVSEKEVVFDEFMQLQLTDDEASVDCDFYCYRFGSNFYYTSAKQLILKDFNVLKYIGEADVDPISKFYNLSIHGGFDILNGSRDYKDWCVKSKFFGMDVMGITEKNTLGGIMKFQEACKKNNIRPILGAQYNIKHGEEFYFAKCYIKDERGWQSILNINKKVNVDNNKFIEVGDFLKSTEGLIIVLDPKYMPYDKVINYELNIPFGDLFWQLDDVEFENDETDKNYLLNVKKFIDKSEFPPILISDCYYLDKSEYRAKELLNSIADTRDFKSNNQYFKHINEITGNLNDLFFDQDRFIDVFGRALENTLKLSNRCEFNVPTGVRLLPEYIMTDKEVKKYKSKEDMFMSLIEEGIDRKLSDKDNIDEYLDRVEEEYKVIAGNGYIDYFLILWDIIKWARENNILVGLARGSAGGCLIAYLLNVIEIDPLKFGLIFERFLSDGRAKKSYPDIDTDFESSRRNDIKRYMEEKYGVYNVCSVGTYTNLKLRQAFKDITKLNGVPFATSNYISEMFDIEEGSWSDIFKTASSKQRVKDFVHKYPEAIEDMRLVLNQPKSRSIHACATVIVPKGKSVFDSIPVRIEQKDGEQLLVSEWEGNELELAGYLKEDILGVRQLDKFRFILDLIKETTGKDIDIYNIPLDEKGVMEMFKQGMNGDVFHFGSRGLTAYCKQMKPENVNDLTAANSLFRPGAMEVNSHNEYILRKNGEREVVYHFMMEPITNETYGLIVYQEQVMKVFQVLADFTLEQADDIRRAIVKKKKELITDNEDYFIKKCVEKGCSEEEAKEIWHEIEVHASYSFNKSHAAAYSITGYISQWLKFYYPLQFWTAAFEFDHEDKKKSNLDRYISEINKSQNGIRLMPPNINESSYEFSSNFKKNEIYWSLKRVKQVGEKALDGIIEERNKNGEFFSFSEFLDRVNKRVVNKAVVINLIFSGAFDQLYDINDIRGRWSIIKDYYHIQKTKETDREDYSKKDKFWWQMKQKEISGFGDIDYKYIVRNYTDFKVNEFIDGFDLHGGEYEKSTVVIAGIIIYIKERYSKKIGEYCNLELECNHEKINITVWNEFYEKSKDLFEVGKILILKGVVKYDTYKEVYGIQTDVDTKIFVI